MDSEMETAEVPEGTGSGYYLFGRDIMAIPCLRESALVGFAASFGVGMLHFLFTSNGRKSFQFAKFAFIGAFFPYIFYCQEERYKVLFKLHETEQAILKRADDEFILTDSLDFGSESWG